jgi:hypothetical protein
LFLLKSKSKGIFFYLPTVLLIILRINALNETSSNFISNCQKVRHFHRQIISQIKSIDEKTVIFIKGQTRKDELLLGEATRVGYMSSEASYAVVFQTKKENIILPQNENDIVDLLNTNHDISPNNVYFFRYESGNLINETSKYFSKLDLSLK